MTTTIAQLTERQIARLLKKALQTNTEPASPEFPALADLLPGAARPAAVLIPFLRQQGEWCILFTRRNNDLPEHSGQVAFPGGRAETDDPSPEVTALREAQEEIGLHPQDVRILGRLHDFLTITNYLVTPVVGVIPWPYNLQPLTAEVSRIFTIPLAWLADPSHHEIRYRELPSPYPPVPVIFFQPYDGEILWGVSARFVLTLLKILEA